jgi:hypothetical protein
MYIPYLAPVVGIYVCLNIQYYVLLEIRSYKLHYKPTFTICYRCPTFLLMLYIRGLLRLGKVHT